MQKRRGEGAKSDDAQENKGDGRTDEAVKRVRGIDIGISNRGAGGRQHARDVRLGEAGHAGQDLVAPGPFAGGDQGERHGGSEQDSLEFAKPALLDRLAHEEEAAERQRNAAGPDHPLGAKAFLQADRGLGGRGRGRGRRRSLRRRRGLVLGFRLGRLCRLRQGSRDRLGRGGFAGEPPFEPGKPEFEPFEALPRVHRHDDADHGEHRNGENESDKSAEHVHQLGWRTKPIVASA